MNSAVIKSLALLPISAGVRRTALAAGLVSAFFDGGLPFVGFQHGVVMGRVAVLAPPAAFVLHLAVALLYGALFSLVLWRSRDWWTLVGAGLMSIGVYLANAAVMDLWGWSSAREEMNALVAHLVFGATFTVVFKLAEIGQPEAGQPVAR